MINMIIIIIIIISCSSSSSIIRQAAADEDAPRELPGPEEGQLLEAPEDALWHIKIAYSKMWYSSS